MEYLKIKEMIQKNVEFYESLVKERSEILFSKGKDVSVEKAKALAGLYDSEIKRTFDDILKLMNLDCLSEIKNSIEGLSVRLSSSEESVKLKEGKRFTGKELMDIFQDYAKDNVVGDLNPTVKFINYIMDLEIEANVKTLQHELKDAYEGNWPRS